LRIRRAPDDSVWWFVYHAGANPAPKGIAMSLSIRPATPEDASQIARLNAAHNDLRATPEQIAAQLVACAPFETLFLAEVDGHVAGMVGLRLLPTPCDPAPYAELTELFVEAAYRRHGVGRALVAHVEAQARERGAIELVLMTAWRNTNAHAFYHALGYRNYTIMMRRELGM
jgi:GNAT superfamily N-acetyltransferase